jgi:iron complex transport system permease protein
MYKYSIIACVILSILLILNLSLGQVSLSLMQITQAIFQPSLTQQQDPVAYALIWHLRFPRALVAMLAGAALALAGAQLQGLLQNPLAAPGVLGTSSGAALGAMIALATGLAAVGMWWLPLLAFVGAAVALLSVYIIAQQAAKPNTQNNTLNLLLAGIAINALCGALISLLISLNWFDQHAAKEMIFWLMGSLDSRTWAHVGLMLPGVIIGSFIAFRQHRELDILLTGDVAAASLGVAVVPLKRVQLFAVALLTGSAVAVSGIIGFVGLIVPHSMRLILGAKHQRLLPASLLAGAIFLLALDLLARLISPAEPIRIGSLSALCGAPFFLYLLMWRKS